MNNTSDRSESCLYARTIKRKLGGAVVQSSSIRVLPILITGALLAVVPGAFAADRYVSTTGNDVANDCTDPSRPCQTIQAAINEASANDTIHVAAGTYPESAVSPLTVNKTLTLLGAQHGVDARTRNGAESVVSDVHGTSVTASQVTIDGFTVQNSATVFTGFGIFLNPGISGSVIVNNIIQNNTAGIGLANGGASPAIIRYNLIQNNNLPGAATGSGIYTDQFAGGSTVKNVLIQENTFSGNADAAIDVSNTDPTGGVFGLDVSTNSFQMNGRATVLFNTHMSSIHDNSIANNTLALSAAIRLFDNNTSLSILNNDLISGVGYGIHIGILGLVGGPSSGVVIHENNIEKFPLGGLLVDPGSHVGTVDATCNWWDSPSGPMAASNPTGTGESVVGDANFTPWLIAPAPGGGCVGGLALTPGKVTGGGQIQGDPLFSPLGDLVSLPAVIPSAASPTAQATFGFVVMCCPPSGNLDYTDHQAGVRIKAQSIDGLFISSGACGTDSHATFIGTASVIRSSGTTTESFTVDVDDCDQTGTPDTFGIKTATYANGPSPLISGTIEIHK